MKSLTQIVMVTVLLTGSIHANAQPKSDIGIRLSNANFNLLQLEFRKPLNDLYSMRFSLTKGHLYFGTYGSKMLANSDTLLVNRKSYSGVDSPFDIRFGVERKLKKNLFSVHSDLIVGYYNRIKNANTEYLVTNEAGVTYATHWPIDPAIPDSYSDERYNGSRASIDFLSTGLALGISLDVPFYQFILGVNAQCVGTIGFPVNYRQYSDPGQDFGSKAAAEYLLYPSAGIALRYVLGKG